MNLAIKGHETRGAEVIEILKMLGGKNPRNNVGAYDNFCFYIDKDTTITYDWVHNYYNNEKWIVFTLEEFLEKFPYKVGDKVYNIIHNENQTITDLAWDFQENEVVYQTNNNEYVFVNYIQPYIAELSYKEETMNRKYNVENYLQVWDAAEKGLEVFVNDNFELKEDNGKFYIIKKQPQIPKTYKECCEVLSLGKDGRLYTAGYKASLIQDFQKLLICRDAYWKIAGEQMGLGKPWKPDWKDDSDKYFICYVRDEIWMSYIKDCNKVLVFPTAEMRDAFFENFKELIEIVKELL